MNNIIELFISGLSTHLFTIETVTTCVDVVLCTLISMFVNILIGHVNSSRDSRVKVKLGTKLAQSILLGIITPAIVDIVATDADWGLYVIVMVMLTYLVDSTRYEDVNKLGALKSFINILISIVRLDKITDDQIRPDIKPIEKSDHHTKEKDIDEPNKSDEGKT